MSRIAGILLRAIPAGFAALALHGIFGLVHWYTWNAYLLIGLSLSLFGWGGSLLRRTLTDRNVGPTRSALGMLSGLPFWFFSGGCGYTTGMLIAKKLLLLGFYDIPVRPIFLLGGIIGCALHVIYKSAKFWNISGGAYDSR
jgi:hypothetical protein